MLSKIIKTWLESFNSDLNLVGGGLRCTSSFWFNHNPTFLRSGTTHICFVSYLRP